MDSSGNRLPISLQEWELQTRRLRLISDMMEDYQDNMRRAMRLIGCELFVSNNLTSNENSRRVDVDVDDWIDNNSQNANTNTYSSETPRMDRPSEPLYSFNRAPPPPRTNSRRGFIYTQSSDTTPARLNSEQIENSTELISYDASMGETQCPITLDHFEPGQNILRINACRHIFGQDALRQWFQRNSRCPVCRISILQPESSNDTEQTTSTNAITQIISGILTGVNGAMSTESGHYENEVSFDVTDLLASYTELIQSQNSSVRNT